MSPNPPTVDLLVTKKIQQYRQGTTIVLAAGWLRRHSGPFEPRCLLSRAPDPAHPKSRESPSWA
jgi:hypothetical protein